MGTWLSANWINLVTSIGVIGSLLFSGLSRRSDARSRQTSNRISLIENHREIQFERLHNPRLARLKETSAVAPDNPPSSDEAIYVNVVIQQVAASYDAMKAGMAMKPDGLRRDVRDFFSRPIPNAIWQKLKTFQNDDFVTFVEDCLADLVHPNAPKTDLNSLT